MTYVLSTIGDRTYLITEDQYQAIGRMLEDGMPRAFRIGKSLVVLHQVTGIDPLETYKRQMRMKLAASGQRMCDRCGTIVPRMDRCPCREQPGKFPDIMAQARLENPALAKQLDAIAEQKQLSPA